MFSLKINKRGSRTGGGRKKIEKSIRGGGGGGEEGTFIRHLRVRVAHANGYIEEINGNKYLIFESTDGNKELLKKYNDVCNGIKNQIKTIDDSKENDYEKNYMKIKFNSDDNLPLSKPLKFHLMTITIRSVFEEHGKLYSQVFFR